MNQSIVLPQDSIQCLIQKNSSKFGIGFVIGEIAGGAFGSECLKGSNDPFSQLARLSSVTLGIVVGGVIGGTIGAAAGADTRYQMDKLDSEKKRKLLMRLFPNR